MKKQRKKHYLIKWKKSAVKSAKSFPKPVREKIIEVVEELREDPFKGKPFSGGLKGLRRIRTVDFRIIYLIEEEKVTVLIVKVGSRGDVYK